MSTRDAPSTGAARVIVGGPLLADAAELLGAARLRAVSDRPYYAQALYALHPVCAIGLGTLAVDRWWRLYVDPDAVRRWKVTELAGVLVHEVHHLLRDHASLGDQLGVTDEERTVWNVAADCAINDDLVDEGVPLPKGRVVPSDFDLEPHRLEAEYFDELKPRRAEVEERTGTFGALSGAPGSGGENAAEGHPDQGSDGRPGCGSGGAGGERPWELEEPSSTRARDDGGLTAAEAELVRRQVAHDVIDHGRGVGTVPAGLERWAHATLRPQVDWRRVFRQRMHAAWHWVSGSLETTYTRPDRRSDSRPEFVFPGQRQPMPDVAVVIDTSASMGQVHLDQALSELRAMLRKLAGPEVWLVSCDARAAAPTRVRRIGDVRLVGGGGTDMRVGIDVAAAQRPRPNLIVVLTDGDTPWPTAAPAGTFIVAVVINGDSLPTGRGIAGVRVGASVAGW